LKILFITPHFPPSLGGVENYVFNIALGLKQTPDVKVVVVTSNPNGKKQCIEDNCGIKVYRLPIMIRVSNTPINPLWYFSLKKIIREEKPDIINSHQPVMFIGDMAAFLVGEIPFILTYHAGTMKKKKFLIDILIYLYEKFVLPHTAKKATKIICASSFVRNTILKKYAFKSVVVHPGVNTSLYKPDPNVRREENIILFIAGRKNMHKMKGLYYLLESIKMLSEIKLRIVGEKSDFTDKRLFSVGVKRGKELVEEMQKASLVVLPSLAHMESFGMVLIEAMACQTPVIGTNIGGIPEVIKNDVDGFIVPAEDSNALALAISKILSDKDLAIRMGLAGEAKVREKFTWDTRVVLTKEVFESCLKKSSADQKSYK
jgi:glycosyltransferase involved in cell wall biosynthesis